MISEIFTIRSLVLGINRKILILGCSQPHQTTQQREEFVAMFDLKKLSFIRHANDSPWMSEPTPARISVQVQHPRPALVAFIARQTLRVAIFNFMSSGHEGFFGINTTIPLPKKPPTAGTAASPSSAASAAASSSTAAAAAGPGRPVKRKGNTSDEKDYKSAK